MRSKLDGLALYLVLLLAWACIFLPSALVLLAIDLGSVTRAWAVKVSQRLAADLKTTREVSKL